MEPQEGDVATGPNGERAVFRGGQWVVESAGQGQQGWQVQQLQNPADERQQRRLDLAEQANARAADAAARSASNDARTQDRQGAQSEDDLRKEFQGLQDVKDYYVVSGAYRNVAATANNESAAGDLSLIFAYMKMLDPTSAVRETEFANAQNAAGVPDQIRNLFNRIRNGERLNPQQRADFVGQAQSLYQNASDRYQQAADFYTQIADARGFEPSLIVRPITDPMAKAETPSQPQAREPNYQGPAYQAPLPRNPDGTVTWEGLSADQQMQLQAGDRVVLPSGETVTLRGAPFVDQTQRPTDRQAAPGLNLREPNALDSMGAIATAAAEQVPFLDEAAAAAQGAIGGEGYSAVRQQQRDIKAVLNQTNRTERNIGGIAGAGLMTAATGGIGAGYIGGARTAGQAFARGAMVGAPTGAIYGAGATDGGLKERAQGAVNGAVAGGLTGGALAAGGQAIGSRLMTGNPSPYRQAVNTLTDNGVSLTPGQRAGGMVRTAENLAMRAPVLGSAIRGARERGVHSLERAVGNRSLNAVGDGVPANVQPGADMVNYVADRLGQEFERGYAMVPQFTADEALIQGLGRIGQAKVDLPPAAQQQFDTIIGDRLARLGQGPVSGAQVGQVRSEISNLAAQYSRAPDPGQQGLGHMLAGVADELDAALGRVNPEAGRVLSNARRGYADYVRMERASTAAGGRPFTPGQLEAAVRQSDSSVRKGAVGRGDAVMQDLSSAARMVMPDQFGNPGTADAVGAGALLTGFATEPATATMATAGLAAAATPYFMMGRKVLERLPATASRQELEAAATELGQLAAHDPKIIILQDEIAKRLAAVSGQAAAQASPRLMTGAN